MRLTFTKDAPPSGASRSDLSLYRTEAVRAYLAGRVEPVTPIYEGPGKRRWWAAVAVAIGCALWATWLRPFPLVLRAEAARLTQAAGGGEERWALGLQVAPAVGPGEVVRIYQLEGERPLLAVVEQVERASLGQAVGRGGEAAGAPWRLILRAPGAARSPCPQQGDHCTLDVRVGMSNLARLLTVRRGRGASVQ
jgi:hypothetical protein